MCSHPQVRRVLVAGVALLALTACEAANDMAKSIGELQQVQEAVAKAAGTQAVQINLMNGKYLSVGIVNSPLGDLPRDAKQAKALELARVALQALPGRQGIEKVRVTFVINERRFLIVNFTDATDTFTFDSGALALDPGAGVETIDSVTK
jgi:hypothetical protein